MAVGTARASNGSAPPAPLSKTAGKGALPPRMYLVTDDGFIISTVNSIIVLVVALTCGYAYPPARFAALDAYEWVKLQMLHAAHRMAWWSLLGLLSSSCCVIQILLNALSLGCSGINSVLGPLRPHFIAVTVVTNAISLWVASQNQFQIPAAAAGCALSVLLTFTPEMLYMLTTSRLRSAESQSENDTQREDGATSTLQMSLKPGAMGCISCVSKVCKVVEKHNGVVSVNVDFENANVSVRLSKESGADAESVASSIKKSLTGANFPVASWTHLPSLGDSETKQPENMSNSLQKSWLASMWGFVEATLAGLLGSSCCLVQLGVNLLTSLNIIHGVGCTGFNKTLGPIRTQLRIVTAVYMAWSWFLAVRRGWSKRGLLARTIVFAVVTFLPEILLWSGGPSLAPPTEEVDVVTFKVDGMGCEACQAHVKGVIDGLGGVVASSVDFTSGMAEVHVARRWASKSAGPMFDVSVMAEKLDEDGYFVAPEEAQTVAASALSGRTEL